MALLKCPECGKAVSEFARECPDCGCPMSDIAQENQVADKSWDKHREKRTTMTQAYSQEELNRALEQARSGNLQQQKRKPGQKRIIKNSESALQRKNKKPKQKTKAEAAGSKERPASQNIGSSSAKGTPSNTALALNPKKKGSAKSSHTASPSKSRSRQGSSPKKTKKSGGKKSGRGSRLKTKILLIAVGILLLAGIGAICFSALGQPDSSKGESKETIGTMEPTAPERETVRQTSPPPSQSSQYSEETWEGTVNHTTEPAAKPEKPTTQRQTTAAPTTQPASQSTAAQPEEPADGE